MARTFGVPIQPLEAVGPQAKMSLDFNGTHSERVVGPVGRSEAHDEGDDTHSEDEQSNDVSSVPLGKHRHCCCSALTDFNSTKTVAVRVVTLVTKMGSALPVMSVSSRVVPKGSRFLGLGRGWF